MNKQTKIAVFFGGKISQHLVLVKKAATRLRQGYGGQEKLEVELDLISYNRICFDTEKREVLIRPNLSGENKIQQFDDYKRVNDYDVLFFRTTGKHWEEVDLIINSIKGDFKKPIIVDPLVENGKPSMACKAWQMLALKEAGIEVPKTVYGSLWYLYEFMKKQNPLSLWDISLKKGNYSEKPPFLREEVPQSGTGGFIFPIIIKGSGGDRGTRVFKADNLEQLEKLVRDLRKSETEEGRRYMLQEFIPNDGDFRVLVLGEKVLGVMKRSSQSVAEFKNNYSAGGKVELAELPEEIKQLAIKAAKVCGLAVAGVDVVFRNNDLSQPIIWEVNKGPQFKGFMEATGIDVPAEMVKFLVGLKPTCSDKSELPPLKREAFNNS
jgi:RimK family alpha-L-glutamate ligase